MKSMRRPWVLGLMLSAVGLAACADERSRQPGGEGDGGLFDFATGVNPTGDGSNGGCSDEAKLVYLVDENNDFLSFKPDTLAFTTIGSLSCPAQFGATPYSMGVDRTPTAWVLYNSGELFQVSTANASCQATSFQGAQNGYANFGMGFASNSAGSSDETLFIAGGPISNVLGPTSQFGTVSFPGLATTQKGQVSGWPELTGTGGGELWGFFPSDSVTPRVANLSKIDGADGTTFMLPALAGTPQAWAFAFWGGDFWVFLKRDVDSSTVVYHVKGTDGTVTTAIPDTSRKIVGAGVSTCAPTMIQ